jgi:hypothetical protein
VRRLIALEVDDALHGVPTSGPIDLSRVNLVCRQHNGPIRVRKDELLHMFAEFVLTQELNTDNARQIVNLEVLLRGGDKGIIVSSHRRGRALTEFVGVELAIGQHENVAIHGLKIQQIGFGWAGPEAGESIHRLSDHDHAFGHLHVSMNQVEAELILDIVFSEDSFKRSNRYLSHLRLIRVVGERIVALPVDGQRGSIA